MTRCGEVSFTTRSAASSRTDRSPARAPGATERVRARKWHGELIPITDSEGDGFCVDTTARDLVYYHRHDDQLKDTGLDLTAWFSRIAEQLTQGRFVAEVGSLWLVE